MLKPFNWSAWKLVENLLLCTFSHLKFPNLEFSIAFITTNVNEIWCICIANREGLMEKSLWLKTARSKVQGLAVYLSPDCFFRLVPEVLEDMAAKDQCHPLWKLLHCNHSYTELHQKDRLRSNPSIWDLEWPSFSKSARIDPWNGHSMCPSL